MCRLKELIDFVTKKYGYTKLYVRGLSMDIQLLATDLPHCYDNYIVLSFKYRDMFKQLDVVVKEDKINGEKEEVK